MTIDSHRLPRPVLDKRGLGRLPCSEQPIERPARRKDYIHGPVKTFSFAATAELLFRSTTKQRVHTPRAKILRGQ